MSRIPSGGRRSSKPSFRVHVSGKVELVQFDHSGVLEYDPDQSRVWLRDFASQLPILRRQIQESWKISGRFSRGIADDTFLEWWEEIESHCVNIGVRSPSLPDSFDDEIGFVAAINALITEILATVATCEGSQDHVRLQQTNDPNRNEDRTVYHPSWDGEERTLSFRGQPVKRYDSQSAKSQISI